MQPGIFEYDLIDADRMEYSRGENDEQGCLKDFHIDATRAPLTQVLFAIVPDPVHTNLALLFDQQMDALQQGVLDSGWSFEKALMPWNNKSHPEPADFRLRKEQKIFEAEQESQPGILLFRRLEAARANAGNEQNPGKADKSKQGELEQRPSGTNQSGTKSASGMQRERLLVFVIGESLAGGINKSQFRSALRLVKQFLPGQPQLDLPIMGPTSSGSLHSLAALLDRRDSNPVVSFRKISVVSGTVTSKSSMDAFGKESGLHIDSLQENDEYVVRLFLRFANKTWGYEPAQIAILSEDETAYGTRGIMTEADSQTSESQPGEQTPAGASNSCEQQSAADIQTHPANPGAHSR